MKKKNSSQRMNRLLITLFVFVGGGLGYLMGGRLPNELPSINSETLLGITLCFILSLIIGINIQVILHEAGHLIGGLLSGYRFVSFRIGKYCFIRENNRIRLCYLKIPGTGGQCLMSPPDSSKWSEAPFHLYNLGGVLLNLFTAIVCGGLLVIFTFSIYVKVFLLVNLIIAVCLFLINAIPMEVKGGPNDGYNSKTAFRESAEKERLLSVLYINDLQTQGVRLSEMPAELFDKITLSAKPSLFETTLYLFKLSRDLELNGDLESYSAKLDEILSGWNDGPEVLRKEIVCERLFTAYALRQDPEVAAALYTPEISAYIAKTRKHMISKKRLLYTRELLGLNNQKEAAQILQEAIALKEYYPIRGEYDSEMELIGKIGEL